MTTFHDSTPLLHPVRSLLATLTRAGVLLLLTVTFALAAQAQLSGTYTVGGASPDYATITDAVNDLNAFGISGPVFFQIRSGTYDEQVTINNFPRFGSPTDAVTFTRISPLFARPVWQFSGASILSNWVVKIDGADYVILQGIEFEAVDPFDGRLVVLEDGADHNVVRNSVLTGITAAPSSRGTVIYGIGDRNEHNTFEGNTITQGYYGIDLESVDSNTRASGNTVVDNVIGAQTEGGVRLRYQLDAIVDGNTINDWIGTSATYTALFADGGGTEVTSNDVDVRTGAKGIQLQSLGVLTQRFIANNLVNLRSGAAADAGIVLTNGRVDLQHNTVRVGSATAGTAALRVNSGSLFDVHLRNNLFINDGGGYALKDPDANIASSDYNDLYTTGSDLADWDGTDYATLAGYKSASGLDAHSVSEAITFVDILGTPDLRLDGSSLDDLDLIGEALGITDDIDGDARDEYNPKMGADEGTPLAPLDDADTASGFYTVAGTAPDFARPEVAFDHLKARGMKGAVSLRIRTGGYVLNVSLPGSVRVGPAATNPAGAPLLVRAANPSNRPLLQFASTDPNRNYVLRLNGFDYVTLENLDLEAGGATLGRIVVLANDVGNLTLDGCTLTGIAGATTDAASLVFGDGKDQHLTFTGNTFTSGFRGLDLFGLGTSDRSVGNEVSGSTFSDQARNGMRLRNQADLTVIDNFVGVGSNSGTDFVGMVAGGPNLALERNRINASGGERGMNIVADGTPADRLRIVNNAVLLTGTTADAGIDLNAGTYLDVYHNTVLVDATGALATPTALRIETGAAEIDIRNNLLVNLGQGPAYVIEDAGAIIRSDYNNLRSPGAYAVWDGVTYASRADLRSAVAPNELHSKAVAVTFVNPAGDLHLAGASVGDDRLAGEPLASVGVDVDDEARSTKAPYMGADEAATPLTVDDYVLAAVNTTPLTVAPGGAIDFTYAVTNTTNTDVAGDFWYEASGGLEAVIISGPVQAGDTFNASFVQNVAGATPLGTYSYTLHIGQYPNLIVNSVPFTVEVTGAPRPGGADEWTVSDVTPWPSASGTVEASAMSSASEVIDDLEAKSGALPSTFALDAAYPNPFAASTTVGFTLPEAASVRVAVYDVLGREVAVLVDEQLEAGQHTARFHAAGLSSGVYLVRMTADGFAQTQRVTLAR